MLNLPAELVAEVFSFLDPHDPASIPTLVRSAQVSHSFGAISQLDTVWRPHLARWDYHPARPTADSERAYCISRAQVDSEVLANLHKLVRAPFGKSALRNLITARGLLATHALVQAEHVSQETDPEYYLSTQYWAGECLGFIRRAAAVETFTRIANVLDRRNDEFEPEQLWNWEHCLEALGAFSAYRNGPIEIIPDILNSLDPLEGPNNELPRDLPLATVVQGVWENMGEQGLRPNTVDFDARFVNLLLDDGVMFEEENEPFVASLQSSIVFCTLLRNLPDHDLYAWPVLYLPSTVVAVAEGPGHMADPLAPEPDYNHWSFFDLDRGAFETQEMIRQRFGPPPANQDTYAPTITPFVIGQLSSEIYELSMNDLHSERHKEAMWSLMSAAHAMLLIYAQAPNNLLPDNFLLPLATVSHANDQDAGAICALVDGERRSPDEVRAVLDKAMSGADQRWDEFIKPTPRRWDVKLNVGHVFWNDAEQQAMVVTAWQSREGFYRVIDESGATRGWQSSDVDDIGFTGIPALSESAILASTTPVTEHSRQILLHWTRDHWRKVEGGHFVQSAQWQAIFPDL